MINSPLPGKKGKDWRLTQGFGERPDLYKQFGVKGHDALDFAGPNPGDKVPCFACYDGEITAMGWSSYGYGNFIKILTDRGGDGNHRELLYAHLDSFAPNISIGSRVYLGDQLGIIGTTGNSTGVHLHLAVRKINPLDGAVVNYDNGFKGRFDYEPFLLEWNKI